MGLGRRLFGAILLSFIGLARSAEAAEPAPITGRPVIEVLQELRGPGLEFIYSSELLPRTYVVTAEPGTRNRLLIAREILAEHGLALSVVRPGLYAVVPAKQRAESQVVLGRVLRAADGEPLAGARVQLIPIGASDWSASDGRFAIGPVPEGDYTLRIDAPGFEVVVRPAILKFQNQTAKIAAELAKELGTEE
jgi:hypothetical protein